MKKALVVVVCLMMVGVMFAVVNFDLGGKIYTQYRWTNASGGVYWLSNDFGSFSAGTPYWPKYSRYDKKYANFMRTEAEFEVNANISKYVKAYLRTKTIFNSDESNGDGESSASSWADDWDDSRGFFKLRGFLIDVNPNINIIDKISLGTPMGLPFNRWLVADRRYIDRDNIKGIVVRGNLGDNYKWNIARMWNAGYMGPGWNGLNSFRSEDATYAFNFATNQFDDLLALNLDAMYFSDAALADTVDFHIEREDDFNELGLTLDAQINVSDEITFNLLGLYSQQKYSDDLDANDDNIADNVAWVTPQTPSSWWGINEPYADITTMSGIASLKTTDPFGIGFTPSAEFFYIDDNFYSPFGSRREYDMLMINGGIDPLRYTDKDYDTEGGREHQSLNTFLYGGGQSAVNEAMTDNNFMRLGEDFYESPIGYWGGTLDLIYDLDAVTLAGQINYLGATDNNDGSIDEEDENYEGSDVTNCWYYQEPRDFSGLVGDISAKTKISDFDLALNLKYGDWTDVRADYDSLNAVVGTHDVELASIVFEPMVGKQLTKTIKLEFRPRYQQMVHTVTYTDEDEYTTSDFVINYKLIYNFGGFDFWVRGEHFFRTFEQSLAAGSNPDALDLSWSTIHAAFEVKF
ncbi:MAG: hypothetical protein Q7J16_00925 [Candidatus Cloacimonadales bacterium]|nr:hypothetical protein [Candidatus Cloacimonadales bacterium]